MNACLEAYVNVLIKGAIFVGVVFLILGLIGG